MAEQLSLSRLLPLWTVFQGLSFTFLTTTWESQKLRSHVLFRRQVYSPAPHNNWVGITLKPTAATIKQRTACILVARPHKRKLWGYTSSHMNLIGACTRNPVCFWHKVDWSFQQKRAAEFMIGLELGLQLSQQNSAERKPSNKYTCPHILC